MHRLHNVLHFLFASLKFREMVVDRVEPQHRVLAEMFQLSIQKVSTSNKSFLPKKSAFTKIFQTLDAFSWPQHCSVSFCRETVLALLPKEEQLESHQR